MNHAQTRAILKVLSRVLPAHREKLVFPLVEAVTNFQGFVCMYIDSAGRIEKIAADGNNIIASEMLVKIAKEERSKELANEMGTPDDPAAVAGS